MPSPAKLLQLRDIYATTRIASPPRWQRSGDRKPALGPVHGKRVSLPVNQWKQWMHDAHELSVSSSVFLATTSDESIAQAAIEGLQLILNPVVARNDEKLVALLSRRAHESAAPIASVSTLKSPTEGKIQLWKSCTPKLKKRKKNVNLRIEPLLSDEVKEHLHSVAKMRETLQTHLKDKIKGNIWENEIRSRLARPLSASTFCSRTEQLRHPFSAAQFVKNLSSDNRSIDQESQEDVKPMGSSAPPRFPYSVEAHAFANCIRDRQSKAWIRAAYKARARVLAIAIRVLRRRGIPLLIQGFRRRRRAAICIQRRYRRFLCWRIDLLRPFVYRNVAVWLRRALAVTSARVFIARAITTLYQARKARRLTAARRASHLCRWAAKTRVSLFVHQIWTVCWFRNKRSCNLGSMKQELSLLEASDHNIHLEYAAVLATPFGKDVLRKEIAVWRAGARTRATQDRIPGISSSVGVSSADIDSIILRLRQCFQIFDLDGSGTLDLDEFQLMLSYLRGKKQQPRRDSVSRERSAPRLPKLTTAQVRNLFAELDQDDSGGITCEEFESWWTQEHVRSTVSTSASINFLSRGLDGLVLQSRGLLFWLLGRKQQLERNFAKKLMMRHAMEKAKREIIHREIDREHAAGVFSGVFRCGSCGRRFGLRRDLVDHVAHECNSTELVVDTFILKRWIREEEFRLLEEKKE